ncbi:MAG: transaldolase, partial [Acidimicrobiaceae bacterium]|nr:transaldolase [Acidimicrobiaceae bacterium]
SDIAKYLKHHHSGAMVGCRLAQRLAHGAVNTASTLSGLEKAVREDRHALERTMDAFGARTVMHRAAAWISDVAAHINYSGLRKRSAVGRLLELETMVLGLEGKRRLWVSLEAIAVDDSRLDEAHLAELLRRADEQLDVVERARVEAARIALRSER